MALGCTISCSKEVFQYNLDGGIGKRSMCSNGAIVPFNYYLVCGYVLEENETKVLCNTNSLI